VPLNFIGDLTVSTFRGLEVAGVALEEAWPILTMSKYGPGVAPADARPALDWDGVSQSSLRSIRV